MNTKLFGLLSVTSLAGAVIMTAPGCTQNTTTFTDDDAGATSSSGGKSSKVSSSSGGSSSSSSGESSSGASSSGGSSSGGSSSGGSSSGGSSSGGKSSSSSSSGGFSSSSGVSSSSSSGSVGGTSCAATAPVDATKFAYTKALKSAGACTLSEVKAMGAYIDGLAGADIDLAAWQKTVSAKCSACAFTDETATSWGPILTSAGKLSALDSGGCIEVVSKSTDCGKAYYQLDQCTFAACDPSVSPTATCQTQDDFDACVQSDDVFTGPCKAAVAAVQTACGASLNAYLTSCQPPAGEKYSFEGYVNVQCVNGQ